MKLNEFIDNYCTACGGNWTSMLMSGIQKLDFYVDVWYPEIGSYLLRGYGR